MKNIWLLASILGSLYLLVCTLAGCYMLWGWIGLAVAVFTVPLSILIYPAISWVEFGAPQGAPFPCGYYTILGVTLFFIFKASEALGRSSEGAGSDTASVRAARKRLNDNLTIDFYDETHAAVTLSWPQDSPAGKDPVEKQFAELLMFACYTIQQLRNLGNHPVSQALCRLLIQCPLSAATSSPSDGGITYPHVLFSAALQMGMDLPSAEKKYGQPVYLIPYRGQGVKRFVGRLDFRHGRPVFFLDIKGWGLLAGILGLNAPLYASDSVLHFFTYLLMRNADIGDPLYTVALIGVARDCAAAYRDGQISALNQEAIAQRIVAQHLPASHSYLYMPPS